MSLRRLSRTLCGLAITCMLVGCGGDNRVKTIKVEGILTLDNKPMSGVEVSFVPDGAEGKAANGITGSDGSFRLTTYTTGDGIAAGSYKVVVKQQESATQNVDLAHAYQNDPAAAYKKRAEMEAKSKAQRAAAATAPKKAAIPSSYSDIKTTNLKMIIPPPEQPLKLDLRSSGA